MGKRQITHGNHTVPQFYLRKWSNNGNTVNCYHTVRHNKGQKVWSSASIKSASVWRDIYTQSAGGNGDSIEHLLCACEEEAAKVIKKLDSGNRLSGEEMGALVDFAIVQMVRTPKWLLEQNRVVVNSFRLTTEETIRGLIEEACAENASGSIKPAGIQEEDSGSPFPQLPWTW